MGNTISAWGGRKKVQSLINNAGLPLKIDDDDSVEDSKAPLSPYTEAYPAKGWFTGVRSQVTVPASPDAVYESLSKDLHKVFTPMSECHDEIQEDDEQGQEVIFRIVRIPFKVAFVTGNLKLRLSVRQNEVDRKIHFESIQEGRLITKFVADFDIVPKEGTKDHTIVSLDAKINAHALPPPPFKGMVKDVMVRKMDSCMVDLVNFHTGQPVTEGRAPSASLQKSRSGFLTSLRRSLGQRPSLEKRPSLDRRKSTDHSRGLRSRGPSAKKLGDSPLQPVEAESCTQPPASSQAEVFSEWQRRHVL